MTTMTTPQTTISAREARTEFDSRYGWYEALHLATQVPARKYGRAAVTNPMDLVDIINA